MKRPALPLALLALLVTARAFAQPDPKAEARRYFDAGEQAYAAGQYDLALRAYEEAYQRAPLPAILFSIAQAHRLAYVQDRDVEKLRKALELYRRYLEDEPRGNRRAHATQHLDAIEKILAALAPPTAPASGQEPSEASTDTAPPPAAPPATLLMVSSSTPDARARIDDGELTEVPFAAAVAPGKHRVRVEAPGHFARDTRWLAVEGRLVVAPVDLAPRPARVTVRAPDGTDIHIDGRWQGVAPLSAPVTVTPGLHVVSVSRRGHRTSTRTVDLRRGDSADVGVDALTSTDQRDAALWVLGGAGALALAGATTAPLAVLAEGRVKRYDERQRNRELLTEADRLERERNLEARNDLRTASYMLFGGALVAGITGGLLFLLDTPHVDARPVIHPGARVQGAVGPGWAAASLSWMY
jgi:tetratricopeptide (TPR) repeat protein